MKTLLTLIHSRTGAVIQWLIGIFIGWLTSELVALGIEIPAESFHQLSMGLEAIGAFLVTFAVQWYQSHQARKLQLQVEANPDGWIGPETIAKASGLRTIADYATRKK